MSIAIAKPRLTIALMAMAAVLVGSLWTSTARSEAARVNCGTFRVLHNDRIGNLSLPKGRYTITVVNDALPLTCSAAINNFRNFLWDYDGVLPRPWKYRARGVGNGKFFQRTNKQIAFTAVKQGSPAPSPAPTPVPAGRFQRCKPQFNFTVENNDRIGALVLPRGLYYVYRTTDPALGCQNALRKFRLFLNYPSGVLPAPWRLNAKKAIFTNPQKGGLGFRVKQAN